MRSGGVRRFAPSTTGPAHPGTLLAALLCWLDARSAGARLVLRLEDLDPERCRPEWRRAMTRDLAWLGLAWDEEQLQSQASARHAAALDRLAEAGRLYACTCSRADLRAQGRRAPDGGYAYSNRCRESRVDAASWRSSRHALRAVLPEGAVDFVEASGRAVSRHPARDFGDPVVRRRDGAVAYHLASVVDDAAAGVTEVVRGHDLLASTPLQVALQRLLGLPTPRYRHHLLLLEERGRKLAKFHGAVAIDALRAHYGASALCGVLASAAGLLDPPRDVTPGELLETFRWEAVSSEDRVLRWTGESLELRST